MKRNGILPDIEIIDAIDEDHAHFMEECCIQVIGRKDLKLGPLLNQTNGGEGTSNPSEETRIKIGAANKGIVRTPAQIKTNSDARLGVPTGRKGVRFKQKDTTNHGNRNKIRTQEFKDNLSVLHTGKIAWNKGKESSKTECVHCGKLADPGNMKKNHGSNCKYKESKNGQGIRYKQI